MKTATVTNSTTTKLRRCERNSLLSFSSCAYWWQAVRNSLSNLVATVRQNHQTGRSVSLQQLQPIRLTLSGKHYVGAALMALGVLALFVHQILFDPFVEDHQVCQVLGFNEALCVKETGWCYTSWFWYLYTVRFYITMIFWSVALLMFIPAKYTLSFIPCSLIFAYGAAMILHYSFYTHSFETFHAFPKWSIILFAVSIGVGVIMSIGHILHFYNHRILAVDSRERTIYNGLEYMTGDEVKGVFKQYVEEKRAFQKQF